MSNVFDVPYFSDWPQIQSLISKDPALESRVAEIVGQMTLEEKVGQMIQPELRSLTPQEVIDYKIGSILNGGGSWPDENKLASSSAWVEKADAFWLAAEEAFVDRPFRIPFIWATDAVHGHNNAYHATVFPHNIGLGCARDPELIHRIGRITAKEIAVTGLDWTFAPTVATPRDLRWGRVYEGYAEDPEVTYVYAAEMVKGLQGDQKELQDDHHVISNVKHWVGDGGTAQGVDRGINHYSEALLRNVHAMGYFSGLDAGAQVVMSSFNSWECDANYDQDRDLTTNEIEQCSYRASAVYNNKVHGSRYLLTDVLKEKMGFDGLVVTDWHGHSEVSKCSDNNASYAINAGNDVLMVPVRAHWKAVYRQTVEDVNHGIISMARIDDAVTRILRVKMRAGLWEKPQPSARSLAAKQSVMGCDAHREVAREAVRKSMVLLKNKGQLLPLKPSQRIILTGSAAHDLQKQSGGWNLTWQGDENSLSDFPGATTVKMAFESALGESNVTYDPQLKGELQQGDIAVVAFGEDPYAEMMGDIKEWQSLAFSELKRSYAADCEKIANLKSHGLKVIALFFSGRPLYLNQEIALSDAFIAAFLPGSEGDGIADVMVGKESGEPRYDFQGTLSYSWPNRKNSYVVNCLPRHIPDYQVPDIEQDPRGEHKPLFEYGYGLNYTTNIQELDLDNITLDQSVTNDENNKVKHLFGIKATLGDYKLKVVALPTDDIRVSGIDISRNNTTQTPSLLSTPFSYQQQQDAITLELEGGQSCIYIETGSSLPEPWHRSALKGASVLFDVKVDVPINGDVALSMNDLTSTNKRLYVDVSHHFTKAIECFQTVTVPMSELISLESQLDSVTTPFELSMSGKGRFVIANIRWEFH